MGRYATPRSWSFSASARAARVPTLLFAILRPDHCERSGVVSESASSEPPDMVELESSESVGSGTRLIKLSCSRAWAARNKLDTLIRSCAGLDIHRVNNVRGLNNGLVMKLVKP